MTIVWYRETTEEEWRKAPFAFQKESNPHEIADRYNEKYNHGMWWVNDSKPGKSKVPEGKEYL